MLLYIIKVWLQNPSILANLLNFHHQQTACYTWSKQYMKLLYSLLNICIQLNKANAFKKHQRHFSPCVIPSEVILFTITREMSKNIAPIKGGFMTFGSLDFTLGSLRGLGAQWSTAASGVHKQLRIHLRALPAMPGTWQLFLELAQQLSDRHTVQPCPSHVQRVNLGTQLHKSCLELFPEKSKADASYQRSLFGFKGRHYFVFFYSFGLFFVE